jgi:hypothetical protein
MTTGDRAVNYYDTGEQTPPVERLRELLVGRRIVSAEKSDDEYDPDGFLRLDDGTTIKVKGNDGGCACSAGCYPLARIAAFDSVITNVEVDYKPDDESRDCGTCGKSWCYEEGHGDDRGFYRVYVIGFDTKRAEVASFEGSDGDGYYGTGWWLEVIPAPAEKGST